MAGFSIIFADDLEVTKEGNSGKVILDWSEV